MNVDNRIIGLVLQPLSIKHRPYAFPRTGSGSGNMAFPTPAEIPNTSLPLPDPEAYPGEPREYARALMQRKDELEREIVGARPLTDLGYVSVS
jgi:hypothetical protein